MKAVAQFCKRYPIVPIIIIMFIVFSVFSTSFLAVSNILNIFMQMSIYGTMALGMTYLIITGYFDLSAGTLMGFAANLVIILQIQGLGIALSVILTILVGAGIGMLNGLLVTKAKINAFIVTLAMMNGLRGAAYIIDGANQILGPNPEFANYGNGNVGGVSYMLITYIILFVIFLVILKYTRHGRDTYAIGGNTDAAFNAGVNVSRVRVMNFMICSLMAGIGGVMTASRMNAAQPYLGYPDGSLMIITCVVLGGTSLNGGRGGILFTLGGTIAYFMFRNGLNMMNVPTALYSITTGLILIGIVTFDRLVTRRTNTG